MYVSKDEVSKAIEILKGKGCDTLVAILEDMHNRDDVIDLINREYYFATCLWQKEDIEDALISRGADEKDIPNLVEKVLNGMSISQMEDAMCEVGWSYIKWGLDDILER